jgi:peptidyl-prolyl cis-trans isomerase SurA
MPANFFEQYKKELSKKVLDEMVVDILIGQKAEQKGIVVTDQEIDNRINDIAQRQKMSLQDYHDMLKAKGEDFSQFGV